MRALGIDLYFLKFVWSFPKGIMMYQKYVITAEKQKLQNKIHSHIEKYWKLYAIEGSTYLFLGIAAYIIPHFVPKGVSIILGSFLLVIGLMQFVRSIIFRNIPGLNLFFFTGLFQFAIGVYFLVIEPSNGQFILTMLLVILFLVEGAIKLTLAYMLRPLFLWHEFLFSGFTSIAIVAVILTAWPETATWPLGLLLGANMFFFGSTLLNVSLNYKSPK